MRSVVDSHFHIFRRAQTQQAGILAAPYLQRDFDWADYRRASAGVHLEGSVMVQVNDFTDPLTEVGWVASVAAEQAGPAAMVAYAQLEADRAAAQIAAVAAVPIVRGVRRNTQHEKDDHFCARPEYIAGVRHLGALGLCCDVCVKAHQLDGVAVLAARCPETTIVLNHLGKPDLTSDLVRWRADIERLAQAQNVVCKISVVVHTDRDPRLTDELAEPLVRGAVDAFGWDRVLFGSNWPVALAVVGYSEWVEMLERILARADETDLQKLFVENARRVYRLD